MTMEAVDWMSPDMVLIRKEEQNDKPKPFSSGLKFDEVLQLADWVLANPEKWPTAKAKLRNPQMTCRELAQKLGIDAGTVSRHLKALKQLRKRRSNNGSINCMEHRHNLRMVP